MEKDVRCMYFIEIEYNDGTSFSFDVFVSGQEHEVVAHLMMITRGTLMASSGSRAVCYRSDGFDVCSYVK